jgi:APA family basic amino acid/polyamine antiporter
VACLAAVVAMAFVLDPAAPASVPPPPPEPRGLALLPAMGAALLGVMWTYDGYADIAVMGGEIRRPGRAIPRALLGTMLVITAVYLLANAAFFLVLPLGSVAASELVISDVAAALLGPRADAVVTAMAMVSAFGALNGVLLAGPRITYAIARDGLMFPALSRVNRGQTPVAALALQVGMALLLMSVPTTGDSAFDVLTSTSIFVIWLISFFASLSLLVFRVRYPDAPRPFRLPLYPWSFGVHLLVSAGFLASTVYHESGKVWMGLLILAAGVPAYVLWRAASPTPVPREAPAPEDAAAEG